MALGAEGLSHVGFGRWSDAARCFDESESQLRELGDRFALANTLYMRVHLWTWRGDLPRAVDAATRLRAVAAEAANVQHQVWALVELMALGVITGDLDAARAALVPCEEMVQRTDALSRWRSHGVRAMLHRAMGDTAKARAHADEALVWMRHSPPSAFADYHAVMGVAEVSLDQWDVSGARAPRGDGVALSRSGATALGRLFPVLQARASWLDGEVLHREGRAKAALDAWRRGVERARAHGMTYDEALNAWSLRRDPREGATWRRRARDGFLRAGAHGWVRRVDEEP